MQNNWLGTNGLFNTGDVNGDGNVDGSDFSILGGSFNKELIDLAFAADFDDDYDVDQADLDTLSTHFNQSVTPGEDGDVNGDGLVSISDLTLLANQMNSDLGVLS